MRGLMFALMAGLGLAVSVSAQTPAPDAETVQKATTQARRDFVLKLMAVKIGDKGTLGEAANEDVNLRNSLAGYVLRLPTQAKVSGSTLTVTIQIEPATLAAEVGALLKEHYLGQKFASGELAALARDADAFAPVRSSGTATITAVAAGVESTPSTPAPVAASANPGSSAPPVTVNVPPVTPDAGTAPLSPKGEQLADLPPEVREIGRARVRRAESRAARNAEIELLSAIKQIPITSDLSVADLIGEVPELQAELQQLIATLNKSAPKYFDQPEMFLVEVDLRVPQADIATLISKVFSDKYRGDKFTKEMIGDFVKSAGNGEIIGTGVGEVEKGREADNGGKRSNN